jgi:hypothetical protein
LSLECDEGLVRQQHIELADIHDRRASRLKKQRTIKRLSSRYLAAFNKALVFATRAKFSIAM